VPPPGDWTVEHMRERDDRVEAWLFHCETPGTDARVCKHLHVTLNPDRSEDVVNIDFRIAGRDRVIARHYAPGTNAPN
jgi:invasion protein IalB